MQIKSITITNFRSYYETTVFNFGEGLTLIIGDNGDGKTTFFDAIEWLFDTSLVLPKMDVRFISQKRISRMVPGDTDKVLVSMDFEHNGRQYSLERSFSFSIDFDNRATTSNFEYLLYMQNGVERQCQDGKMFECLFDTAIRRYCLFKGESELNIFNKPDTINLMINTFSELKNFDPYVDFSEYAKLTSERAKDNALASDKKNAKKAKALKFDLDAMRGKIGDLEQELQQKQREATNFTSLLENLEQSKEAAAQLKDINDRISNLDQKRWQLKKFLREDYTIRLLDDKWVLCGFAPIAQAYTEKINALSKERRKQEAVFQKEQGAQQAIKHVQETLQNGATPLPIYVPNEQVMREMLHDKICKVCGREAPEGSDAYNFMQKRLNDYLESLKLNDDDDEARLFVNEYITELDKRGTLLHNDMPFFTRLPNKIRDEIEFINKRKNDLLIVEANIAAAKEDKMKILAQTQGVTEDQLISAYANISGWWNQKNETEKRIVQIEEQLKRHNEDLNRIQDEYDKISMDSPARNYANIHLALRRINDAFKEAKQENKRKFLNSLEKYANEYLQKLNNEDFTGIIRLVEMPDGSAEIKLKDSNGLHIFNPNTALRTTANMSILFAVAELTTLKRDSDYPLVFDAPTSSFAEAKESDFFKVVSGVNKQTIIVTKSFLKEGANGKNEVDMEKVRSLSANIYRIEKLRPFDGSDLSTIQTVALKIK